ncbi:hypothetical protein LTR35_016282 [Friedmanniomyces endolithicus]|uniref:Extracellular membrane protein CFEM domain-containing protein n=1 Tax=Friedmanniomyces endolithicus TaxID=329885 RepID=A0A4U0U4C0_9PEZI|nr:hypothetical protein LTS09_005241 [Friedmanniomyces endolithicus]KAK0267440.1 hypothetical protein LTR35_016282 [Friedmanniomyces endolithicus]KAK0286001.1 hypothetical protein LTS00_010533 [Friedmanniomyces endolithicus]KAK0321137.1 hypothetical protein LTR82_008054 [Friedmanniomyces endolithicus]KAK0978685.1 hypothetical protein LTR54_015834 [Friedmanniomyces endolithicus]
MKSGTSGAILLLLCSVSLSTARNQPVRRPVVPHVDPVPVDPVPVDPIVPVAPESPAPAVENPGIDPISDPSNPPTDPNASPAIPLHAPNSPFIIPGIYEPTSDAWLTLGSFNDKNEAPFTNFEDEWNPCFSEVYDVFVAEETYYTNGVEVAKVTGAGSPFESGEPTGQILRITKTAQSPYTETITTTFDPTQPTDVCRVWKSIAGYCASGGTQCACYSGSYYVPDQWNTLASICAQQTSQCPSSTASPSNGTAGTADWCSLASRAASFSDYCPTSIANTTTVAFAASMTAVSATTTATDTSTPTSTGSSYTVQPATPSSATHAASTGVLWIAVLALLLNYMYLFCA